MCEGQGVHSVREIGQRESHPYGKLLISLLLVRKANPDL